MIVDDKKSEFDNLFIVIYCFSLSNKSLINICFCFLLLHEHENFIFFILSVNSIKGNLWHLGHK